MSLELPTVFIWPMTWALFVIMFLKASNTENIHFKLYTFFENHEYISNEDD